MTDGKRIHIVQEVVNAVGNTQIICVTDDETEATRLANDTDRTRTVQTWRLGDRSDRSWGGE